MSILEIDRLRSEAIAHLEKRLEEVEAFKREGKKPEEDERSVLHAEDMIATWRLLLLHQPF